ncbi:MAG: CPXCG motif-containing cysteine-rich protein [Verrucomicrobia bacterium]|nr:CPXCG motif-containing cysteine-rich protein [Verrucomicrobiota bacterium]
MDLEQIAQISCPYCGAVFSTFIDTSQGAFCTIEDCQVCCRPIQIDIECTAGEITSVDVRRA